MKKLFSIILFISIICPQFAIAQDTISKPASFIISGNNETAILSWKNPNDAMFSKVVLFRSTIPIENYFSYGAVDGLCDKIYTGTEESFVDMGLAANLPYYYIIFASNKNGVYSEATVIERKIINSDKITDTSEIKNLDTEKSKTLAGAASETVNQVSADEANLIYNFNSSAKNITDENSRRLALFIIVKSPHSLNENDKNAISYFIHEGTPTTIVLGTGERTGVLNSYLSAFDKLPRSVLEWQDIIKIANGRWPTEKSLESEEKASSQYFSAIYERK